MAVLRGAADTAPYGVASSEIAAGTVLTPALVGFAELGADSELSGVLFRQEEMEDLYGRVIVHSMAAGEPFTPSVLRTAAVPDGMRAMGMPIEIEHAAGGRVASGDRIDVVAVSDGVASIVARNLEVIYVPDRERGGIAGPGSFFVVVAVDIDTSLQLAEAMASARIELLLSTGAGSGG